MPNKINIDKSELMNTKVSGKNIIIKIPIDLLVFAQKNREDSYIINDKEAMAEYISDNILDYSHDVG
jgi:hypothetical protein